MSRSYLFLIDLAASFSRWRPEMERERVQWAYLLRGCSRPLCVNCLCISVGFVLAYKLVCNVLTLCIAGVLTKSTGWLGRNRDLATTSWQGMIYFVDSVFYFRSNGLLGIVARERYCSQRVDCHKTLSPRSSTHTRNFANHRLALPEQGKS